MPSSWLMARKDGLYCRVFIPTDLRPVIGQRYLVRSLAVWDKDQARLIAARYAVALGDLFRQLRKELLMSEPRVSDIIQTIKTGGARDLTIRRSDPLTGQVEEVVINNERDAVLARKHMPHLFQPPMAPVIAPQVTEVAVAAGNVGSSKGVFRLSPDYAAPISHRVAAFKEHLERSNSTTKYVDECLRALEILKDISGDLPPDDYSPRIVDEFMERVKWLPRNPEKDKKNRDLWRKISFLQATHHVEIEQLPRISESTVTKHVIRLSAFFSFCKRRRYMGHDNPFSGRTPKRKMTKGGSTESLAERLPFDMQDLEQIFSSQLYKTRTMPHTFWPPLIALMTGARVNEISQLYLDDIVNDIPGKPDAWRFMILAKRTDQRVKNESALRSIPMHPRLIEMGFLCYLEDLRRLGHQRVFPSLVYTKASGYGDTVSEFFSRYLRDKVKIKDPRKVFHSFRHWFCHQLFNQSNAERMHVVSLTGHAREGTFERTYAHELHYEAKLSLLNRLPLPMLELPVYKQGDCDPYYKKFFVNRAARARRDAAKDNTVQGASLKPKTR